MKKSIKPAIITASAFLLSGFAVLAVAGAMVNGDFGKLTNVKYETNTVVVGDAFKNVRIAAKTDNIMFRLSDDGACKVECYEQEKMKHSVEVSDQTLDIRVTDTREWYEVIGLFSFDSPKVTVYLPEKSYHSLSIHSSTGSVEIPGDFFFNSIDITGSTGNVNCSASSAGLTKIKLSTGCINIRDASHGEMQLSASTGNIHVSSVSCKGDAAVNVSTGEVWLQDAKCRALSSDGSTGTIRLKNVIASRSFSLTRSTGEVTLDGCDAQELFIKTATGNVTGSLLRQKVFLTETATGKVSVPPSGEGGKCEIKTSTGNINIKITEE